MTKLLSLAVVSLLAQAAFADSSVKGKITFSGTPPKAKTFKKPQVMFKIHCNMHPWMFGYIGVMPHPFYAVTREDGSFEIKGLAPGRYTLEAWHEKLGARTVEVTVGASGGTADLKFDGG